VSLVHPKYKQSCEDEQEEYEEKRAEVFKIVLEIEPE
jgi:hypothetical protein